MAALNRSHVYSTWKRFDLVVCSAWCLRSDVYDQRVVWRIERWQIMELTFTKWRDIYGMRYFSPSSWLRTVRFDVYGSRLYACQSPTNDNTWMLTEWAFRIYQRCKPLWNRQSSWGQHTYKPRRLCTRICNFVNTLYQLPLRAALPCHERVWPTA